MRQSTRKNVALLTLSKLFDLKQQDKQNDNSNNKSNNNSNNKYYYPSNHNSKNNNDNNKKKYNNINYNQLIFLLLESVSKLTRRSRKQGISILPSKHLSFLR